MERREYVTASRGRPRACPCRVRAAWAQLNESTRGHAEDAHASRLQLDPSSRAPRGHFGQAHGGRYVASEYANSGILNERSDIYSFGVVLLECVIARDPVDYANPADDVNLLEWLKMMVTNKRADEVVHPNLEVKPPKCALKQEILVGFKCVDPDVDKSPKMSHVVQMLEGVQNAYHQNQRKLSQVGRMEIESQQPLEDMS
ncbi:Protein kinase superfamily protein [Zea mays]|uniref:Protein kinase superfamily protein n=1 Tax=Zea mays TaxID=4577 RepID=A0A1D6QEQ3_MAIZE|nr:Protein kinase superfamily protein [Zea mays]